MSSATSKSPSGRQAVRGLPLPASSGWRQSSAHARRESRDPDRSRRARRADRARDYGAVGRHGRRAQRRTHAVWRCGAQRRRMGAVGGLRRACEPTPQGAPAEHEASPRVMSTRASPSSSSATSTPLPPTPGIAGDTAKLCCGGAPVSRGGPPRDAEGCAGARHAARPSIKLSFRVAGLDGHRARFKAAQPSASRAKPRLELGGRLMGLVHAGAASDLTCGLVPCRERGSVVSPSKSACRPILDSSSS
jgi:hypothetical protein